MRGLLGSLISQGFDGNDSDIEISYRPRRQFTRADFERIANRGAEQFRDRAMNLISCFGPLEGEFGLYSTLSNFVQTKNALTNEINAAVQDGDEVELTQAFTRAMEFAFVTLFDKNALVRLQLVENFPAEALVEYARMRKSIANILNPVVATPVAVKAPTAPPAVIETPVQVAAREWKELPGDKFRVKYLNHRGNRKFYEEALAQGLIR